MVGLRVGLKDIKLVDLKVLLRVAQLGPILVHW